MKIALIGPMASGKTTIGKRLSAALQLPFFDTDAWLEEEVGMTVTNIFSKQGEPAFRNWETRALQHFLPQEKYILSTGGGIIKRPENRELLSLHATVIYLNVSIPCQLKRTEGDTTRPILRVEDKEAVLMRLREERAPLYQSIANLVVNADQTPNKIVKTIIKLI